MIVKINKIPDALYDELYKIIQDKSIDERSKLAGNLQEEFNLNKYIPFLEPYMLDTIKKSNELVDHYKTGGYKINTENRDLCLSHLWVNYMKKHEFNPIHEHSGVFSFIIFIKIPYTSEEQRKLSPGKNSNNDMSGKLEFLTYNSCGKLDPMKIDADVTWEKSMLIFPAKLGHVVYPFYGTDEYRITISGNISVKV